MKNIFLKLAIVGLFCSVDSIEAMETTGGASQECTFFNDAKPDQLKIVCGVAWSYMISCKEAKRIYPSFSSDFSKVRIVPVTITKTDNANSAELKVYLPYDMLSKNNCEFSCGLRKISLPDGKKNFDVLSFLSPYKYEGSREFLEAIQKMVISDSEDELEAQVSKLYKIEKSFVESEQKKAELIAQLKELKKKATKSTDLRKTEKESARTTAILQRNIAIATAAFLACLASYLGYAWRTHYFFS